MSLTRPGLLAVIVSLIPAAGWAQNDDPFFRPPAGSPGDEDGDGGEADDGGELRGSLTSTTFGSRETAGEAQPVDDGFVAAHESDATRLFTDLRARLDRDDLAGMDLHADLRLRVTGAELGLSDVRLQSGAFGGAEYQIRELYATRAGASTDYRVGRQVVGELASTRIDGLRLTHRASDTWRYLGFAGLYPARSSRSVTTDYPLARQGIDDEVGTPILPVAAGAGTAYRYDRIYGSLGVVGIVPLAEDRNTGELETPRVFATSSGYWRQSLAFDLFHHVVFDGMGAAGPALTNLHLGGNWRPVSDLRVSASVTRVDTETLNVVAQRRLRDRAQEGADEGLVQNYLEVERIAQESARLGVSAALADRRFEVSTIGTLRRRPEVEIGGEDAQTTIPAAQAADVTLRATDRQFFGGLRLAASVTEIFGVGANNLNRARSRIFQLRGSRAFSGGRGNVDVTASYLNSADEFRGDACLALGQFEKCYGTTELYSGTLGTTVFYRINGSWMALGGLEAGLQKQFTVDSELEELSQPPIVLTTGFARVAYRF